MWDDDRVVPSTEAFAEFRRRESRAREFGENIR